MKLYEKSITKYSDGSIRNIYHIEPLKSCNELKGFLLSFQNKFGDICDIIVKRYVGRNEVLFYKRYADLYYFLKGFELADIKKFNIYEFLCSDMHCVIDTEKDIIDIYRSEDIVEPESDNYEYYKFSSGLVVRYNNENGRCCYLDENNKWVRKNSLQSIIDDAAYAYKIIDDPLENISAKELDKYKKLEAELVERFKEFCFGIEFIEM